ncbi:hypothetical protein SDC9_177737 [bioreactor metagenome]|uniref:PPM-type phosphatase domain-containing protein n=1 Tax=bioreactor metagenome TaxID=1076179 RepID=A0A645H1R6_9ZZZZ
MSYLLGILDIRTGEVRYTNAGHPAPCVRRSGGALELLTAKHGPPVGSASGARYGSGTVRLEKGDTLLLYTDGVTGMLNPSGTAFGSDALLRVVAYRPEASPDELGAEILDALDRFSGGREQADDLALLILRFDGYEEKGASSDV